MSKENLYRLAGSTAAEPLINSWVAWADLISPVPYSLHLLHYQIKTLKSFLSSPETHVKACKNPRFLGSPFVDVPAERAPEVAELLAKTERDLRMNIELAGSVTGFWDRLSKETRGQSLEPYYEKVPRMLRGYVELVYDYHNHPILHFLEGLLYKSAYYNEGLQSLRIFKQERDDSRRFFLSTPRLHEEGHIDWSLPFDDPAIDEFFKLDSAPRPLGYIGELLAVSADEQERLVPLLTQEPVAPAESFKGDGVRIRYFGHACVLVEWNGVSILTDPWIGIRSCAGGLDRLSYEDLPEKINFALITHAHNDHLVFESLLRLRHKIECLVVPRSFNLFYGDPSLRLVAQRLGFKHVIELDLLESIKLPDGEIIAIPFLGEHADLAHGKTGYVIRAGTEQILFAADSNCLDKQMYEHVRELVGEVGTVFLGMECVGAPMSWLYGAMMPTKLDHAHDQSRRTKGCDASAALDLLDALGCSRVYIYAMGSEPWLRHTMGLALTEESAQIRQSNEVIMKAREKGFADAQRPYGRLDIHLPIR